MGKKRVSNFTDGEKRELGYFAKKPGEITELKRIVSEARLHPHFNILGNRKIAKIIKYKRENRGTLLIFSDGKILVGGRFRFVEDGVKEGAYFFNNGDPVPSYAQEYIGKEEVPKTIMKHVDENKTTNDIVAEISNRIFGVLSHKPVMQDFVVSALKGELPAFARMSVLRLWKDDTFKRGYAYSGDAFMEMMRPVLKKILLNNIRSIVHDDLEFLNKPFGEMIKTQLMLDKLDQSAT